MDKFPMMLFKAGGEHELHGLGRFSTLDVRSEEELTAAREDGWADTTVGAIEHAAVVAKLAAAPAPEPDAPPTDEELAERARQLGEAAAAAPAPAAPAPKASKR